MKSLRFSRFLLLLLMAFVLILNSTNAEVRLQQASDTEAIATAHASMMTSGEEHCDICPDSGQPLPTAAPCVKCIPWMQVQLFTPAVVPFAQPLYLPFIPPLSWIDYQSLPWKPPRHAVING